MIIIIHGDDTASSRNYLVSIKQKTLSSLIFDGAKVQVTDLAQALEGSGLFEEHNDIFIEDFFSKRKGKDFQDILDYITSHEKNSNIYFWEGKKLTAKQTGTFKKAQVQEFKLPQALFSFLDSIGGNSEHAIKQFHEALKTSEPELLFFMITRHFRILLALADSSGPEAHRPLDETIDEVTRMAPWQRSKMQRQSSLLGVTKLKNLYRKLLDMEMNMKTGGSILTLTQAIDFFLTDL